MWRAGWRAELCPWRSVGAMVWPAAPAYAQFQGPAPTKADSPNPENKGLVERAPTEVLPGGPIILHPGDGINVSVYGVPDYKVAARIAGDGNVDLPLIGSTQVAGLTVEQAQKLVAKKLIEGQMIISPDVLISVTDSNVDIIGVMGEVNSPKAIPAFAPMSLFDALSAAGGLKPDASHSISILRKGVNEPLLVVLNSNPANAVDQNIPLYPGDRVHSPAHRSGLCGGSGAAFRSLSDHSGYSANVDAGGGVGGEYGLSGCADGDSHHSHHRSEAPRNPCESFAGQLRKRS